MQESPYQELEMLSAEPQSTSNPTDKLLAVTCKQSKRPLTLNVTHMERALNVLLRLAPTELRQPVEFLDDLYEIKRMLRQAVESEAEAELKRLERELHAEPRSRAANGRYGPKDSGKVRP